MDLLYDRLAADLRGHIEQGVYGAGERLPGVRVLARTRRVSVATVLAAYRRLEDEALIEARARSGYYLLRVRAGRASGAGTGALGAARQHSNRAAAYEFPPGLPELRRQIAPHVCLWLRHRR